MKFTASLFCVALAVLLLFSCRQYRYIYSASKPITPFFEEKGDALVNISYSSASALDTRNSGKNMGYDLQLGYAVGEHFAIIAGTNYKRELDHFLTNSAPFDSSEVKYKRRFTEIGAGYFTSLKQRLYFSIYGGVSFGSLSIADAGRDDTLLYTRGYSATMHRYFLQPGIYGVGNRFIRANFSIRISKVFLSNVRTTYSPYELEYFDFSKSTSPNYTFTEPTLTTVFTLIPDKSLLLELSFSQIMNNDLPQVRRWNTSVGLTVDPFKLLRK